MDNSKQIYLIIRLEGTSRGFWSNLLPKVGSKLNSDLAAQGFMLLSLENFQGWRQHNLSVQPVPTLNYPQ